MKHESQIRILHLLHYLCQHTDEEHPASVAEILSFWREQGIVTDRRSVYGDIALLMEQGVDIVHVKGNRNSYFLGSRMFELPEVKLLVDAVESSRFITRKKSAELIGKLASLASSHQAGQRIHRLCRGRSPYRHPGKRTDPIPVHRVYSPKGKSPQTWWRMV